MAYQALELGTAPDDGTGDSLRVGGDKLNDNFVELYTALGDGDALSSGISASATVITLTSPIITTPVITEIDSGSTITLDATTDIILDADGGDIFFKDAGTTFGSATNTSGNLIIKSGTTTAATFAGANVTLAGTLGVGAITTTGAFKGADGYTIGNASVAAVMTLASTGIVTFADDILIKNDGTIGSAGAAAAMTISSAGIVTFVDDILIKNDGTIGSAGAAAAMTISSGGIVTFVDDILIKDGGTIGAASAATAITIASSGIVTLVDDLILKDAATIGVTSSTSAISIAATGIVTFVDDILIKDAGTIGSASAATAITIASTGIVTFVDDIIIKDAGTIGSASDVDAIAIASNGVVTFSQIPVMPANSIDSDEYIDGSIDAEHLSAGALAAPLQLDGTPGTDHTANGPQTNTFNAGYGNAVMDLVYLGGSSTWLEADSDAVGTSINLLGIALAAVDSGAALNVALAGSFVRDDTFNFTPGVPLYVSGTLGAITATKPTGSGDIVRTVGYAATADVIYFNPSSDYVVLA
jgi:hypothetical protein